MASIRASFPVRRNRAVLAVRVGTLSENVPALTQQGEAGLLPLLGIDRMPPIPEPTHTDPTTEEA